jgi:hypothetical protein
MVPYNKGIPMRQSKSFVVAVLVEGYTWFASAERGADGFRMLVNTINDAERFRTETAARRVAASYDESSIMDVETAQDRTTKEISISKRLDAKRTDSRRVEVFTYWQSFNTDGSVGTYMADVYLFMNNYETGRLVRWHSDSDFSSLLNFLALKYPNRIDQIHATGNHDPYYDDILEYIA